MDTDNRSAEYDAKLAKADSLIAAAGSLVARLDEEQAAIRCASTALVTNSHGHTAAEIVRMDIPPVQYVVSDLITVGLGMIAAPPKAGKSLMMTALGLAVSTGGLFLGKETKQGRCLYLALEDIDARIKSRLLTNLDGRPAPDNFHIYTQWPRLDNGGDEQLRQFMIAYPDTRVIIVDPLQRVRAKPSGARTATLYGDDYNSLLPLKALADAYGIAVIVVHHTRKSTADDVFDTFSGTQGLTGGLDSMLVLSRNRTRSDAVLTITGRDMELVELALQFDSTALCWRALGDASEFRMSQERANILTELKNSSKHMTPRQIAAALGTKYNTTRNTLSKMLAAGIIRKDNNDSYYYTT